MFQKRKNKSPKQRKDLKQEYKTKFVTHTKKNKKKIDPNIKEKKIQALMTLQIHI